MLAEKNFVVDVAEADFEREVIERSRTTPVVVDFWAPWCGPCRVLGPTLEKLAREGQGAWILAKVNVDNAQRLAMQYGIQGIPAVKAFKNGRVATEFVGAQPEAMVRRFLSQLAPNEAEQVIDHAEALARAGKLDQAAVAYRKALEADADDAAALLGLARVLLMQGQDEAAVETLRRVVDDLDYGPEARALLAQAQFVAEAHAVGGVEGARAKLAADPNDPEAQFGLAAALVVEEEDYREALETLLGLVRRNRRWRDDAARLAMINLFDLLGDDDPLTREYRAKLAQALF